MHYPILIILAAAAVLIRTFFTSGAALPFLVSSLGGLSGLWAVSLLKAGGISLLSMNAFTAFSAAILGIPGVIGMLLLRVIALI